MGRLLLKPMVALDVVTWSAYLSPTLLFVLRIAPPLHMYVTPPISLSLYIYIVKSFLSCARTSPLSLSLLLMTPLPYARTPPLHTHHPSLSCDKVSPPPPLAHACRPLLSLYSNVTTSFPLATPLQVVYVREQ